MVFNSLIFLFIYFPLTFLLYNILPGKKIKNYCLLLCSLLFYAWDNPTTLVILILLIIWNWVSGIELENLKPNRRKAALIFTVVVNLLPLCFFKYLNFILGMNIKFVIPLGLSFFTFSSLSYIFDVANGRCKANKDIFEFALFISFFGKISMGPIVSYGDMEAELSNHPLKMNLMKKGIARFIKGLVKKVLLADQFSLMVVSLTGTNSMFGSWLLVISYTLQLYFDFSGYSDMAIGMGNMFGFDWKENFNHPYQAVSVQDFWRRWHISLSTWFRDYLYFPLGGSRVSNLIYIRNMMIVWLATGIWHGANWTFIVWGLYYGLLNILEKYYFKNFISKNKIIGHIYTLIIVIVGWTFFMSADISTACHSIAQMFGFASSLMDSNSMYVLGSNLFVLFLGIVFCTNIYEKLEDMLLIRFKQNGVNALMLMYVLLFVICIAFIVGSTQQTFLYSAF